MNEGAIEWLAPSSLPDAVALRAERGDEATVIAGGTFLGILMNQGFLSPSALLSLGAVEELRAMDVVEGELRIGATVTHRELERDERVRDGWPVLARAFGLVASPAGPQPGDGRRCPGRRRLCLGSRPRSSRRSGPGPCSARPRGERVVAIDELILGYYETCIGPDELLVEVRVPPALRAGGLPEVPFALVARIARASPSRPSGTPGRYASSSAPSPSVRRSSPTCAPLVEGRAIDRALACEVAEAYAERVEAIDDARGSAAYRRRVTAVEVRRAIEELAA